MNPAQIVFVGSWIVALLLVPGSFVLSFWTARRLVKDRGARVALTIGLGLVILAAGLIATVGGCAAVMYSEIKLDEGRLRPPPKGEENGTRESAGNRAVWEA